MNMLYPIHDALIFDFGPHLSIHEHIPNLSPLFNKLSFAGGHLLTVLNVYLFSEPLSRQPSLL